jgi:hypothetical protein
MNFIQKIPMTCYLPSWPINSHVSAFTPVFLISFHPRSCSQDSSRTRQSAAPQAKHVLVSTVSVLSPWNILCGDIWLCLSLISWPSQDMWIDIVGVLVRSFYSLKHSLPTAVNVGWIRIHSYLFFIQISDSQVCRCLPCRPGKTRSFPPLQWPTDTEPASRWAQFCRATCPLSYPMVYLKLCSSDHLLPDLFT